MAPRKAKPPLVVLPKQQRRLKIHDPDRRSAILEALAVGMPRRHACMSAGISDDTLARMLKSDADFAEQVKAAEASAVERALGQIVAAASDDWKAAAWILERRWPQEFGRKAILAADENAVPLRFTIDLGKGEPDSSD